VTLLFVAVSICWKLVAGWAMVRTGGGLGLGSGGKWISGSGSKTSSLGGASICNGGMSVASGDNDKKALGTG
jgi:hypothetical protein